MVQERLALYDAMLGDSVYEKIWSELSRNDRKVMRQLASGKTKIIDLREALGISPQLLNVYRKRLMDKGIISGEQRGSLKIVFPRLAQYIEIYCPEELD